MLDLYNETCTLCSKLITNNYSTSFSLGIKAFAPKFRNPIYAIYGFVRFADEIVDTFHDADKKYLLDKFKEDTYEAIDSKLSLNPVLHAFQLVVNKFHIPKEYIEAFLYSMEMDLYDIEYTEEKLKEYIYGSAEVVGLMCLKVFCENNHREFKELEFYAKKLGSAFQKINFLRDIKSDYEERGRLYFPNLSFENFSQEMKSEIEDDLEEEFNIAYQGILRLPQGAKLGVYTAYKYYLSLFLKIKSSSPEDICTKRIRISNRRKIFILSKSAIRNSVNLL